MLRQMEGARAVAEAVALSRPEVICAHPIMPQAHIVEALGAKVKAGTLRRCEFLNVESEFAAMSVAIGASAAGARAYTATASQGLLYMSEAVYNAAGLGLPIVMTVANRVIGAPINIWNDHSDAMSQRDAGWIQLYAETNQEALDLHIQAFRLAEDLSVPVMVCMDGFLLTHAFERADVPTQEQVDGFLGGYEPRQVLDPAELGSIGAMVGPEAFTEVRYLTHARQSQALELIPQVVAEFGKTFGRDSGGLVRGYCLDDAETAVREALGADRRVRQIVVLERAFATGMGGIVSADLRMALAGHLAPGRSGEPVISTVIAGLGGRAITQASVRNMLADAAAGALEPLSFLDLKKDLAKREFLRMQRSRRSGPSAENMLRDHGTAHAH
jgi:pyruvate ferredoxin oxidoreductase alpha subunit